MKNDLNILIKQCEKQALKLTNLSYGEEFIKELDIFDSYFEQLKQAVENEVNIDNSKFIELKSLIETFMKKVEKEKDKLKQTINQQGKNFVNKAYSDDIKREPKQFDERS